MNCKLFSLLLMALFVAGDTGQATVTDTVIKNLGSVGKTYPVAEPDITEELRKWAANLDAGRKTQQFLERMKSYQPANLQKLPTAKDDRTFQVNMSYTIERDITDYAGNIIYSRGFVFNPLEHLTFPGGLVVIDGTDPLQIKWFKSTSYADNHRAKLLLSDGYAQELGRQLHRSVFYLTADLAKRLRLVAVPSVIVQKGQHMEVHEVKVVRERLESDEIQ